MDTFRHSLFSNMFLHCLLTLLLLFVVPIIASRVEFLPGFEGRLPFHLETGYIGVGKNEEVQLFHYFIKSESDPANDPLILWLTGGPACSGFNGLVYEIGPLYFTQKEYNGSLPTLGLAQTSWTTLASIIFLEQPVNTGFSYPTTPEATNCTDLQACDHTYEFLLKWLIDHPEFISNDFYLGGDSYAGLIAPRVAQLISDGIEAGTEPSINLKGYVLGNPLTFASETNYQIPLCHGMGLISDELYQSLMKNCKGEYKIIDPSNVLCSQDVQTFKELISHINDQHILEPVCGSETELFRPFGGRRSLQQSLVSPTDGSQCHGSLVDVHMLSNYWANDPIVQKALHVRKGTITRWARCKQIAIKKTYAFTYLNSISYHANLSSKGYRSLIYSGDHDLNVPFQSTEAWIKSLNYSVVDEWRPWTINGQVAGYTRSYSNKMTFATVKGAGHIAPEYKREDCFLMFERWLSHDAL